ncbi:uncharacterized protein LOC116617033 [Nematostella vectensis]|uniref:uncharacterized protein LOC116617033 n=1 Tax=Nematostella vectensis TaxID=45351 RepID=UPI002076ECF3|nr:uncharacterized protein LOC116617033 [Nematostella vectensis]
MPSLLSIYLLAIIVFFSSVNRVKPPIFGNEANMRLTKNRFLLTRSEVNRNNWGSFDTVRLTQTFRGTYIFATENSHGIIKPVRLFYPSELGSHQIATDRLSEGKRKPATDDTKQETARPTANQHKYMLLKCRVNMSNSCTWTEFLLRYDVNAIKTGSVSSSIDKIEDSTPQVAHYIFGSAVFERLPASTASERFHLIQKVWQGRVNDFVHKLGTAWDMTVDTVHGFVKDYMTNTAESIGNTSKSVDGEFASHSEWPIRVVTRPRHRSRAGASGSSQRPNEAEQSTEVSFKGTMAQSHRATKRTRVKVIYPINSNDTKASNITTDQASNGATVQSNKGQVPKDTTRKKTRKPFANHRSGERMNGKHEGIGLKIITPLLHELYSHLQDGWNHVPDAASLVNYLTKNFKQGLQIRHRTPERRPKVRLRDYAKRPGQIIASMSCLLCIILAVCCARRFSSWRKETMPPFVHRRGKKRRRGNSYRNIVSDFLRWISETTVHPIFAGLEATCSRENLIHVWLEILQFAENLDG